MLPCGVYLHYKGNYYLVLGIGEHTETNEKFVVYISLSPRPGYRMRIRPLKMFTQTVKWPSGKRKPRFVFVGAQVPKK